MRKYAVIFCSFVITLALANFAVSGQIKIPKIFKPKEVPTPQTPSPQAPTPQNPTRQNPRPATRQNTEQTTLQTGGNYVDDGFTWFESVPTSELNDKQSSVPTGWTVKSSVRLMGIYPKRSAFKFVVSRGGKVIGTTRCEASSYNIPAANPADVSFIYVDGCFDKTAATKEIGKFDVEVIAVDGNSNAETSVRKYKIEVLKVDRVNGQIGKTAAPDSPRYVISRHAETTAGFLFLRPANAYGYTLSRERSNINLVEIYYSVSPYQDINTEHGVLRCAVDGKRLQFPGEGLLADLAVSHAVRRYEEIYSDRLAAQYQSGPVFKDSFGFELIRLSLPFSYGAPDRTNRLNMNDYPGNWECSLMKDGEKIRTFRWTVGRDGMPVKHAEQNGNVNLYFNSYLIETEVPEGGSVLDKRLAPTSPAAGFFYGQPWTTAEGKSAAAKAATKGNPAPLPSNKIK